MKKKKSIAIELKNVSKEYKKNKNSIKVFQNINYKFQYGNFYCLYGNSGVGKTTLIEILGTMKHVTEGELIIDNVNVNDMSSNERANLRNKKIGFIFQSFNLIPELTSLENVILPMYFNKKINKDSKNKIATNLLYKFGLEKRINHYINELSGGEQQRVAIARALINEPKIILADEPTGNLDEINSLEIMKLLKSFAQEGKCVIVVSHDSLVKKYADICINLNKNGLKDGDKNE